MIFNTSLDDGIDLQDWKMANVTPVFTGVYTITCDMVK